MAKWNLTDLEREISDLREQLRKAQERIRAAEAEKKEAGLREIYAWGQAQDAWDAQKAAEADTASLTKLAKKTVANNEQLREENRKLLDALAGTAPHVYEQFVARSLAKEAGE